MKAKAAKGSGAIAAILAAGGRGSRFAASAGEMPKQFFELRGKPIYVWPLRVLLEHETIQSVVLTMPPELTTVAAMEVAALMDEFEGSKSVHIIAGGTTRQESVWLGLEVLASIVKRPEFVLIHDAARPFLTAKLIDQVVEGVKASGACTVGLAPTDTVKKVDSGIIAETLDRSALQMVQTPQAGRMDWLLAGHRQARKKSLATTDDAAILESAGHKVTVVRGSALNLKITTREDLELCDAIFGIATAHPL